MFGLLNHLERERELLCDIKDIDAEIHRKNMELEKLKKERNSAADKLNQIRRFIAKYMKELPQETQ